ncbi:hypothetical protein SNEBB_008759 [Seison nebaliae]|nr:hypothetical protein SNEBB_008759 [Seison nebaliae]
MKITICKARSGKMIGSFNLDAMGQMSYQNIKVEIEKISNINVNRQSLRRSVDGKAISERLDFHREFEIGDDKQVVIYVKDLGPQIGWSTVFIAEYFGPLVIYLLIYYLRKNGDYNYVQKMAVVCYAAHYIKRIFETIFIHRFSHATMPIMNLFKNCSYYWGFTAFISYFVNSPLTTLPYFGDIQFYGSLISFILMEFGNFSIHLLLRELRPPGSTERVIPVPNCNPMTLLFNYVSCPNYFYEFGSWLSFSIMCQSLPAFLFASAGFGQMAIWALGKHRRYNKEFAIYPKERRAIVPFIL